MSDRGKSLKKNHRFVLLGENSGKLNAAVGSSSNSPESQKTIEEVVLDKVRKKIFDGKIHSQDHAILTSSDLTQKETINRIIDELIKEENFGSLSGNSQLIVLAVFEKSLGIDLLKEFRKRGVDYG